MSFEPKPGVQGAALYQRIRNDLEARIMSGAWPPGHRVPFEHELMETYSCSRMTVNKVLSALADSGLVVRRRRAGSFVARPRVQSAILQIPDLKAEVEKRGERYGYRLLALHKRAASAKRIIASLRALGITPVLPGYYGIVPADFATLHPGAHVKPQGDWNGFTRPGWIDPRGLRAEF